MQLPQYTNAILLNAPRAHGDFRLQSMLPPEAIILILPEEDLPVLASAEVSLTWKRRFNTKVLKCRYRVPRSTFNYHLR